MRKSRGLGIVVFVLTVLTLVYLLPKRVHQTLTTARMAPAHAEDILREILNSRAPVTLVNLWATWCDPCKEEFPALLKLRDNYINRGLNVILVSADADSQRHQAEIFLTEHHVTFQTYIKSGNEMNFINTLLPKWDGALPVTAIYNAKGDLVQWWQGQASYEKFEGAVLAVLFPPKRRN